jgi:hypothetical protein
MKERCQSSPISCDGRFLPEHEAPAPPRQCRPGLPTPETTPMMCRASRWAVTGHWRGRALMNQRKRGGGEKNRHLPRGAANAGVDRRSIAAAPPHARTKPRACCDSKQSTDLQGGAGFCKRASKAGSFTSTGDARQMSHPFLGWSTLG